MEKTRELKWTLEEGEVFIDHHTSYIGNHFYDTVLSFETANSKQEKKKLENDIKSKM